VEYESGFLEVIEQRWLVTTNKLASELPVSKAKKRRSDRCPVVVPVKVKWLEPKKTFKSVQKGTASRLVLIAFCFQ
jgi:hypothetical protein